MVAGIRTPQCLTEAMREKPAWATRPPSMETAMPESFAELTAVFDKLERHYRDMQDIEFTIERRQVCGCCRPGQRQAHCPGGPENRRRYGPRKA